MMLWAALALACASSFEPPAAETRVPVSLEPLMQVALEAVVGSAIEPSPAVVVRDQLGNPLPGATVNFIVAAGGGSVTPASAITDENGIARVISWIAGTVEAPSPNHPTPAALRVSVPQTSLPPVTFTARIHAGPPISVYATPPPDTLLAGETAALAFRVVDEHQNALLNVPVTVVVAAGGGLVAPLGWFSHERVFRVNWTVGSGENRLAVSVDGGNSPVFTEVRVTAPSREEFTWYDLEGIEGCQAGDTPQSVIGLHEAGMFLLDVDWPYSVRGRYTQAGDSLRLFGSAITLTAVLANDYLTLDLGACNDWWSPANWTYRRRVGPSTGSSFR